MKIIFLVKLFFVTFHLSGCTTMQSKLCEFRGGAPWVNLGGYQGCVEKYKDGGKACTGSEECEGDCFLPWDWNPKENPKPEGRCAYDVIENCVPVEHYNTVHGGCIEE